MKSSKHGFTLIELLVVIAIIGILSSVVLAALNGARGNGADAAVKSELDSMRAQAEEDYSFNSPSAYNGSPQPVCTDPIVIKAINNAASTEGISPVWWVSGSGTNTVNIGCNNAANTWIIWVQMPKGGTGKWWCVDNNGSSIAEGSSPHFATTCP